MIQVDSNEQHEKSQWIRETAGMDVLYMYIQSEVWSTRRCVESRHRSNDAVLRMRSDAEVLREWRLAAFGHMGVRSSGQ
jgi:hypothetical protein